MTKSKRAKARGIKWTIVFGVIVASAFGAGYLMAADKTTEEPNGPQERFLLPEGYTVDSIYPVGANVQIRAKDAAGDLHMFIYRSGKGDQKIRWHAKIVKVPADQAFDL